MIRFFYGTWNEKIVEDELLKTKGILIKMCPQFILTKPPFISQQFTKALQNFRDLSLKNVSSRENLLDF